MQRQCIRIPLRPDCADEFMDFVRELGADRVSLADVLTEEGMETEFVFIERSDDGASVIIYTRAPDLQRCHELYLASEHPVQQRMRELSARAFDVTRATQLEVALEYPMS